MPNASCCWFVVPFQTHVWYPQSYNPNTGLFYVGIRYATYGMVSEAGAKMGNQLLSINVAKRPEYAPPKLEGAGQWLTAWDPVTQKEVWRAKEGTAASGEFHAPPPAPVPADLPPQLGASGTRPTSAARRSSGPRTRSSARSRCR